MSASLNRFNLKQIAPINDVRLFKKMFPVNGILRGCVLTHLGSNQVSITAGTGILEGEDYEVTAETLLVQLASSGTMPGRIYVHCDLSDTVTPISILSVCASSLPALVQDANFLETNGVWEEELATYTGSTTAITSLTTTYKTIDNAVGNIIDTLADLRALTSNGSIIDAYILTKLTKVTSFTIATGDWGVSGTEYAATKTLTGAVVGEKYRSSVQSATDPSTATEISNEALYKYVKVTSANTLTFRATAIPSDSMIIEVQLVG